MAAAGSQVIRYDNGNPINKQNRIRRIDIDWTSDASGDVNELQAFGINGRICTLITNPLAGPTDNYDVQILDEFGIDVLQGLGADRDTTNSESVNIVYTGTDVHPAACGPCTLKVAAAGNAESGTVTLFIEQ